MEIDMMRRKYKKLLAVFLGAACIANSTFAVQNVSAASTSSTVSKALKAYRKVLSQKSIKWGDERVSLEKNQLGGNNKFGLLYVNNDNVPELAVYSCQTSHAQGYYALYTYKNGKVVQIGTMMDGLAYYPKRNIVQSIHSGTGGYEYYYFTISGTHVNNYLHKVSERESLCDLNGDGKIGETIYSKFKTSKGWDMIEISKKAFYSKLKQKTKGTKLMNIKWYDNTSKNRLKRLR